MSIPNRAPGTVWALRSKEWSRLSDWVRTAEDDCIDFLLHDALTGDRRLVTVSRSTARLLAKRINQCLDATVKR